MRNVAKEYILMLMHNPQLTTEERIIALESRLMNISSQLKKEIEEEHSNKISVSTVIADIPELSYIAQKARILLN